MSTTFDVYPRTPELPTFRALLDHSTEELQGTDDQDDQAGPTGRENQPRAEAEGRCPG